MDSSYQVGSVGLSVAITENPTSFGQGKEVATMLIIWANICEKVPNVLGTLPSFRKNRYF